VRLLIIGAAGFIGSHLVQAAAAQGHKVIALSRGGRRSQSVAIAFRWSFGEPVPAEAVQNVDCAIHLAHDFGGEEGARRTIESTLRVAAELRGGGVCRQLFFSSYSAGEHAVSLYGKTKLAMERAFAGQEDIVVVRPGLVIGEGGIYGRIRKWAQTLPLIPLPDGGTGKVPVIAIGDLCARTLLLATMMTPPREENLFEPDLKSLRELVLKAAEEVGRRPRILPVSSGLLIRLLAMAGRLGIPLPVDADNLIGFLANQKSQHKPKHSQSA
jgi:nucleoside-diphosphate-sugar epimerase